jgi:hypothetical protein
MQPPEILSFDSQAVSHRTTETEVSAESTRETLCTDKTATPAEYRARIKPIHEYIPWHTADDDQPNEIESKPLRLTHFIYNCSYLSPFTKNLYTREHSAKGWYRWVGPDPVLEVRLPLAPTESDYWLFTVTFHAFLDESHSQKIIFKVNDKRKPLEWLEDSIYRSRIDASELFGNTRTSEFTVVSLSIGVPTACRASEQDQRIIAFAIRELSLIPT